MKGGGGGAEGVWLCVCVCLAVLAGGGPAGEASAPSARLPLGVPLAPATHLHVQKSAVLKCCGGAGVCGRPLSGRFGI